MAGIFAPEVGRGLVSSFDAYLAHYARLAQKDRADLLAIRDEFPSLDAVPAYRPYWLHALAVVRRCYKGPVTYGANHSDYR